MADLDTRSKRASSVNALKAYAVALVLPDGTLNQADRQHSAWSYSGILAQGVGAVVSDIFRSNVFVSRILQVARR